MANRERKIYTLSKKNVDYIEEIKEKRDLKYNSEAVDLIIREHRINSDTTTEVMMNLIGEKLSEQLKVELSGIKKASNQTDKNTQIIIELLNGLFVKSGYSILATTDDIKCEAIDRTIEVVERRIAKKRVAKLDRGY
ncbi:hypothetical protein [Clostridium chauvoei]|uniref:Uncharacterized protein n=1 Tax=Clostridium chauvoei TaxID=46867 RepID=A0ABD4RL02_9CLOT|nr:hypothetical protein [Clostridium chauvoei]ATD56267.1 hypothetical protein BTM20_13485 [Clostridium chauvoei]MBX7281840.1 hypothetical protein [Clostridium chauvoei]MBX7284360.1 hypothetical protein [Clostridium chauvoei]MBX7286880.1 hypothetical protein [Clostridium chauvoei]MBX7289408.1 hypothetical protein [Clostridium chauvoei]